MKPHLRWLIRRDLPEVLDIERLSFAHPWSEQDFAVELKERNVIATVAEFDNEIVGFMVYEIFSTRLELRNFAVHPDHRRRGIGAAMLDKLASKLSTQRRNRVVLKIGEWNTPAHLFFASQGYVALGVVYNAYPDGGTAYKFEYRVESLSFST